MKSYDTKLWHLDWKYVYLFIDFLFSIALHCTQHSLSNYKSVKNKYIDQSSHSLEVSKFPTISQLFISSSSTISQPKIHGIHNFSDQNSQHFHFCSKCTNYFAGHFPTKTFFLDSQLCWTNVTNSQLIQGCELPKSNSQLFLKFLTMVGTLIGFTYRYHLPGMNMAIIA